MDLYFEMLKKPVFSLEDVEPLYKSKEGARSALKSLLKKGQAAKIRNGMYTCISGESLSPVANRFQIASSITPSSYVSHHSALEYHGVYEQVYFEVHVSSDTPFKDFSFDGYSYRCIPSKFREGVISPSFSGGVSVTDMERTIVDSIKDMDKISGLEEVIKSIDAIERIDEKKLLTYLGLYGNQFLYQKIGFLLYPNRKKLKLSPSFFEECKRKSKKSKRYLSKDYMKGSYCKEWGLIIPLEVLSRILREDHEDV